MTSTTIKAVTSTATIVPEPIGANNAMVRDRFANPEYINPDARLPRIQALRGENGASECGYFITKVKTVETELSGLSPYKYPADDSHINDLGFQLLKARKTEEAYKLFKHSELQYPDSWEVYHGLGETYRQMGEKQLALTNYKKSLKLNPNNEDGQRAIARLNAK